MKCIAIWYEEILSSSFCCKVPNNTWFPWFRNTDLSIPYINCSGRYMYILERFRINIYPDRHTVSVSSTCNNPVYMSKIELHDPGLFLHSFVICDILNRTI